MKPCPPAWHNSYKVARHRQVQVITRRRAVPLSGLSQTSRV
ncbi:hypothetical protein AB0F88_25280 [Streptosporangium sp. NPDC023963]